MRNKLFVPRKKNEGGTNGGWGGEKREQRGENGYPLSGTGSFLKNERGTLQRKQGRLSGARPILFGEGGLIYVRDGHDKTSCCPFTGARHLDGEELKHGKRWTLPCLALF
jgi:hypothetical protein